MILFDHFFLRIAGFVPWLTFLVEILQEEIIREALLVFSLLAVTPKRSAGTLVG